jgi:hypothetical protein
MATIRETSDYQMSNQMKKRFTHILPSSNSTPVNTHFICVHQVSRAVTAEKEASPLSKSKTVLKRYFDESGIQIGFSPQVVGLLTAIRRSVPI